MLIGKCIMEETFVLFQCSKQLHYQLKPDSICHGSVCVAVLDFLNMKNYYVVEASMGSCQIYET
jgi:hypothetical protein